MPLIKVPQPYAVSTAASRVRDALTSYGERIIILRMFHVNSVESKNQPRCAVCYDSIYKESSIAKCTYCYGTTFQGGVQEAWQLWGIVTDETQAESISKTGVWEDRTHTVQTEGYPPLEQNDYMIRIKRWDENNLVPLETSTYYQIGPVRPTSVRTGSQYGHTNMDRIGQSFDAKALPRNEVIYSFDINNELTFPRSDGQMR